MRPKRTIVALPAYHGIALTMVWPSPMPPKPNTFISGDATGDRDITGTYKGKPFPKYGAVQCLDPYFHKIACPGTAFFYTIMVNETSFAIGFHTSPKITITNARPYPGIKCIAAHLETYYSKWVWQLFDMRYEKPVGNALTMPRNSPMVFTSGGGYVFAYVCK